jgi:ribosome maturation factor RimP
MLADTLESLVRPVVEGLGYELWEFEYSPRRGNALLRVYIDHAAGIGLDDCERVSRAVSEVLDREDPLPQSYDLEVSSPGIERPLRTSGQFAGYVGETVYVEVRSPVEGRRRFNGPLRNAGATTIEIEVEGRSYVLPLASIRKAHLAPEY